MLVREKIKEYRIKNGLTTSELGRMIDVKQATISRYENGTIQIIPFSKLKKIAEIFRCSVEELTNGDSAYFHVDNSCNGNTDIRKVSDPDLIRLLDWYESLTLDQRSFVRKITDVNAHTEMMIIKS